jgi:hypothetical protein
VLLIRWQLIELDSEETSGAFLHHSSTTQQMNGQLYRTTGGLIEVIGAITCIGIQRPP